MPNMMLEVGYRVELEINTYFSMDGYYARTLTAADELTLQNLCESCSDYYYIVEGRYPEKDEWNKLLTELPSDKDYQDKFLIGIFDLGHDLRGVLDIIRDYPEKGEWIIGLLMINPLDRGKKLGKSIHEGIIKWASEWGAVKLRIAVVEDNTNAIGFWTALGYKEVKRVNMKLGNKDNTVIVMNYPL